MRWEYNHSLIHITNSDKMVKYSIIILITQLSLWGCCRSERSILESFYKALDGDKWEHKENWLSDKPLNEWYGITTDEKGKVVKIQLSDTMTGKVPANLKHLKKLQYLHLNCITGGISLEVNKYPSLKELRLNGYIDWLKVCNSNVEYIELKTSFTNSLIIKHCNNLKKVFTKLHYAPDILDIDCCPNLSSVELEGNRYNPPIDLKLNLPSLTRLTICYFTLNHFDIDRCTNLEYLNVSRNSMTQLDVSKYRKLEYLYCNQNQLSILDVSSCKKLKDLDCSDNQITKLILNNSNLVHLRCFNNNIQFLNVNICKKLEELHCYKNNLSKLDISDCENLKSLDCSNNKISNLDIRKCKELTYLECFINQLSKLNLSNNSKLNHLHCSGNNLTTLDISKCKELKYINCCYNNILNLNLNKCNGLLVLECSNNKLSKLNLDNPQLNYLDCSYNNLSNLTLNNLKLDYLDCSFNNLLSLDLSKCGNLLKTLYCFNNKLLQLNTNYFPKLETLSCGENKLTVINISKNCELNFFYCDNNPIKHLNLTRNKKIRDLNIKGTQLTSIDISHLDKLEHFDAYPSSLKTIWVSKDFKPITLWFIEDDVECKIKQ